MQDASTVIKDWSRNTARWCAAVSLALICLSARASSDDLLDLSFEQLMSLEVTSVSRKAEPLGEAAAAIYVITTQQIRNAGISTIPDALRLAPGVHVAQIDANKWAVSARGFNGRFANKLLVLIDGRSVYTPLFSGVFWDTEDTLLEDIERIEVIRGPGATLWGANAVNGVINIITRSAADTTGGLYAMRHGNSESAYAAARYGGRMGGSGHYRVYGKYFDRDGNPASVDGRSADGWEALRTGTRMDWQNSTGDNFTVSAELHRTRDAETVSNNSLLAPYVVRGDNVQKMSGAHALLHWTQPEGAVSSSGKASFSFSDREASQFSEKRLTLDLDFQQRIDAGERHDFIWGLGYRRSRDNVGNTEFLQINPAKRNSDLYSVFLQDEIDFSDERWRLTVGAKLEHNEYTGTELQPNIRLFGSLSERHTVWAALSSAVRVPSRGDRDSSVIPVGAVLPPTSPLNPTGQLAAYVVTGNDQVDVEDVAAFELGYRTRMGDNLYLDFAAFRNRYERKGVSVANTGPYCAPSGVLLSSDPACALSASYIAIPVNLGEGYVATTYGLEMAADWRPTAATQVGLTYAYTDAGDSVQSLGQRSPEQIANLTVSSQLADRWQLYSTLRYTGKVDAIGVGTPEIAAYAGLDIRLAWQATDSLELALSGKNLNDPQHPEFVSELNDIALTEIRRSIWIQARWDMDSGR